MAEKKYKSKNCKCLADQFMTLVTIYAAIINQEFDNPDDLEILAEFLVALGEQLSLAAAIRGNCDDGSGDDFEVDVDDAQVSTSEASTDRTYIKKRVKKKVRQKSKSSNKNKKKTHH